MVAMETAGDDSIKIETDLETLGASSVGDTGNGDFPDYEESKSTPMLGQTYEEKSMFRQTYEEKSRQLANRFVTSSGNIIAQRDNLQNISDNLARSNQRQQQQQQQKQQERYLHQQHLNNGKNERFSEDSSREERIYFHRPDVAAITADNNKYIAKKQVVNQKQLHVNKVKAVQQQGKKLEGKFIELEDQERPFLCQVCGKRFRQRCHVDQHLRIHTNVRPYQCAYCSKSFKQKSQIDQHERIHTGEKPYKCLICHQAYPQATQLRYHMKSHPNQQQKDESLRTITSQQNARGTTRRRRGRPSKEDDVLHTTVAVVHPPQQQQQEQQQQQPPPPPKIAKKTRTPRKPAEVQKYGGMRFQNTTYDKIELLDSSETPTPMDSSEVKNEGVVLPLLPSSLKTNNLAEDLSRV